jgi:hypothetical protein
VDRAEYAERREEEGSDDDEYPSDEETTEEEEEASSNGRRKPVPQKEKKPLNPWILLFRSIPSNVNRLSIPYSLHESENEFLNALKSKSFPSSIRTVSLLRSGKELNGDETWEDEEEEEVDPEDYEEMDAREQEESLRRIGKILSKKGVDIIRVEDYEEYKQRSLLQRMRSWRRKGEK